MTKNTINVYADCSQLKELIVALRDDLEAGLTEIRSSISTLATAITEGDARDAARIAELEAVIEQLSANDTADAETIARLQAVVDEMTAEETSVVAALADVDASIDALATASS